MGRKKLGLFLLLTLCFSVGCEVTGGKQSSSSSSSEVISTSSSVSTSTKSSISVGLPESSLEFIDKVNNIIVSLESYSEIEEAFAFFDNLEEWNYPEVLEAYDLLCEKEKEYNTLVSNNEKKVLFLEKVNAIPEEFTLDDEYLIIRAEDSYLSLNDELKADLEVIDAYNNLLSIRETFDQMKKEAQEQKDASDAASFLESVAPLQESESLTYSDFFTIKEILATYELLSEDAKLIEGVAEAYAFLVKAAESLNILDGTDLFDIEVIHSSNNWEAMLNIQGISDEYKVTGINKIFNLKVYQDGVQLTKSYMLAWGDASVAYSYTRSNGIHSFSFTTNAYYSSASVYTMSFIVEADNGNSYAVSFYYMVDGEVTCNGYTYGTLYKEFLVNQVANLVEGDYTKESWAEIQNLLSSGLTALEDTTSVEYAKMLCNQYYLAITQIETKFASIETLSVVDVSSAAATIANIIDNSTTTRWQAASTTNEYVVIDLTTTYSVSAIDISWEVANAASYTVKVSNDNDNWDEIEAIYSFTGGVSGNRLDKIRFSEEIECQYIRIDMIKGSTQYGFSIYELDVYNIK